MSQPKKSWLPPGIDQGWATIIAAIIGVFGVYFGYTLTSGSGGQNSNTPIPTEINPAITATIEQPISVAIPTQDTSAILSSPTMNMPAPTQDLATSLRAATSTPESSRQDFSGLWIGTVSQENSDGTPGSPSNFEMLLFQDEDIVEGIATTGKVGDFDPFVTFIVRGNVNNDGINIQDLEIIDTNTSRGPARNGYWCLKNSNLLYTVSGGSMNLRGAWKAENCRPGRIDVQKKEDSPNTQIKLTSNTQNIEGEWTGKIYQENEKGILDEETTFSMSIKQSGENIEGYATVGLVGKADPYATFSLRGIMRARKFELQEYELLDTNNSRGPFGGGWCIKSMRLITVVSGNGQVLRGIWTAPNNCYPGRIEVRKT